MIRSLSIRTLVAGFTIAGILLCLTISFVIVLAFPAPPPQPVTIVEARIALTGEGRVQGWSRRFVSEPPFPAAETGQARLVQQGLATLLGADLYDVRVRSMWPQREPVPGRLNLGAGGSALATTETSAALFALAPGNRFAPFEAAVRQRDGRWLVVSPRSPLLTPQRIRMALAFLFAAGVLLPLAMLGAGRLSAPFTRLGEVASGPADRRAEAFVGGPREAIAAARAIDDMRDRLRAALNERTAIMAAIAHDLRTPLTGLRLRVEGLPVDARVAATADIARMERLIAQLLTFVRGEDAPWNIEPIDLTDLFRDCVDRQVALGRDVILDASEEHLVHGDRDQLDRAISNLIDNAVIYGDRAYVTVRSVQAHVLCTIVDDGPGLPADQVDRVFSPFYRLETSRSRSTGGAGLGLAISRSIVERSGGTVKLSSTPGRGLCAEVLLPRLER